MRTNTRKEAEARLNLTGPFVIQRRFPGRATTYATKTGGWATDRAKAWKFDTEAQANFVLRGRGGEIVSAEEVDETAAAVESGRGKVHELVPVGPTNGKMTPAQRVLLKGFEETVQTGLDAVKEARKALLQIRDQRLYREQFATFEEYMEKRWGFSARHGHRMCDWAIVESNLLADGNGAGQAVLPAVESQARPLAKLEPAEQRVAWKEAVESAPNGKPTAKHVQAAVAKRLPAPRGELLADREPQVAFGTLKFSELLKESEAPEASRDKNGPWVICRPPLPGATSPSAMIPRYSGPGWGWSPNPQKGKPYLNWHEANTQAQGHGDRVVSVRDALQKPPIQVKAHERARAAEKDPALEARFHAIDAAVEAKAALQLLEPLRGERQMAVYHAEKAADHLECLKKMLLDGEASVTKGKR